MSQNFSRLSLLIGQANLARLQNSRILICGLGGVGSWAAEAIARSGVGYIALLDFDTIKPSNINRQMPASTSSIGQYKADIVATRANDINPDAEIVVIKQRLTPDNIAEIIGSQNWTCIIDAIDERQAKIALLKYCVENNVKVISSMGAANRLDPSAITSCDLFKTDGCPMARLLRKQLKKEGISSGITAIYSKELPIENDNIAEDDTTPGEKSPMGSISYITAIFGMHCAATAINTIIDADKFRHRGD